MSEKRREVILTLLQVVMVALLFVALLITIRPLLSSAPEAAPQSSPDDAAVSITESVAPAASGPVATEVAPADGPVNIQWWSHWANEPSKRAVIEKIAADYEAEHPDVTIDVVWWDKNPLQEAVRGTMTAGQGAPDISTFDSEQADWVEQGWLLDLADVLPWENFWEGTELDGTYPLIGYEGNYKFNIGSQMNMIFYNPEIFAELGIEVPEDYQFTEDEFVEVVQSCSDAGYAGVADAIGNRPYPAVWAVQYPLWTLVGAEEFDRYNAGLQSWDTPEARRALEYSATLRDAGLWPDSFADMTIDEFHAYFHTQREACMIYIPTWYTGRAFKPEADGGQDPDWQFGMLRYPLQEGATDPNTLWFEFESGYSVLASTPYPEVAKDILAFAAQPRYGALWTAVTNTPSAIQYDSASDWPADETLVELGTEPGKWDWYWEEFVAVYGSLATDIAPTSRCGEFDEAAVAVLNEQLPQGEISVDEAVETLDAALCTEG